MTLTREDSIKWAQTILAMPDAILVDTESTDTGDQAEAIQIGIVDMAGHILLDVLLQPNRPISREATAVHGFSAPDLVLAPKFPAVHAVVHELLKNRMVVAYNADFDRRILDQTCDLHSRAPFAAKRWTCAMKAYACFHGERRLDGEYKWQSLAKACRQMGVKVINAHSAAGDCLMTLEVIKAMAAA